jgi:hypothetical protein
MGKYDPLKSFLEASGAEEVPMSFEEIEALLGAPLPDSRRYPAWWSNNPSNNVMTRVWLEAGYRTERVDVAGGRVVFRRAGAGGLPPGGAARSSLERSHVVNVVERLQRALAGTVTVAPGVDLTEPTGEVWDAETQ